MYEVRISDDYVPDNLKEALEAANAISCSMDLEEISWIREIEIDEVLEDGSVHPGGYFEEPWRLLFLGGRWVVITITHGAGLTEEDRHLLFQSFTTTLHAIHKQGIVKLHLISSQTPPSAWPYYQFEWPQPGEDYAEAFVPDWIYPSCRAIAHRLGFLGRGKI